MEKIQYKIDVFEGPLDLLLHLISKHKLNINDIPIFDLVEQYIDYVHRMEESDMEIASEFVEMAARLIYIKTVSLLPVHEEAEQLKKELAGELIEYRDCKLMAQKLSEQANGFDYFERKPLELPVNMKYERLHEPQDLLRFYLAAVGRGKNKLPPPFEAFGGIVAHKIVSVNSRIVFIYRRLLKKAKTRFGDFFEKSGSRSEMVATFLALLELVKANKITVDGDGENSVVSLDKRRKQKE
ncbi:MAG: segregation/condensation protein A [Faecalibacterium sp.]|nr:segregation/condensation protein A [Ruminococcus sp.]MCM1392241.1 segregation/condensation protein A [Ruminococcus sp.]MCM1484944.1 segregation/condensation protein A [Faecalibacterium sp.]